jgi:hypothetical protein
LGGFEDPAAKRTRFSSRRRVLALTVTDRASILRARAYTPSDGLAELRGVLLVEHEWRVRGSWCWEPTTGASNFAV